MCGRVMAIPDPPDPEIRFSTLPSIDWDADPSAVIVTGQLIYRRARTRRPGRTIYLYVP